MVGSVMKETKVQETNGATPSALLQPAPDPPARTPGYRTPDQEQADIKRLAAHALGAVIERHLTMATGDQWNAESLRAVVAAGAALLAK